MLGLVVACGGRSLPHVRVEAHPAPVDAAVVADSAQLPTIVLPCIPGSGPDLLSTADGEPVLCWDTGCAAFDSQGDLTPAARPPMVALPSWRRPTAVVRDDGGHLAACDGARCQRLGAALAAEIEKRTREIAEKIRGGRDDLRPVTVEATDDLEAVTIDGEPWGVRADRKLAPPPPKTIRPQDAGPVLAHVVGNHLVLEWKPCAGPCAVGAISDSLAKRYGSTFETGSGGDVIQLDDERFVVVADTGVFTIVDLRSGKVTGSIAVAGYPFVAAARLGEMTFGVLAQDRGYLRLTSVDLTGEPQADRGRLVPGC